MCLTTAYSMQQLQHLGTKMDKVSTTEGGVIYTYIYILIGLMSLFHQVSDQTIQAILQAWGPTCVAACMQSCPQMAQSCTHTHSSQIRMQHTCMHMMHAPANMHAGRHACCSGWEDGKGHEVRGSRTGWGLVSSICMQDSFTRNFMHGCMIAIQLTKDTHETCMQSYGLFSPGFKKGPRWGDTQVGCSYMHVYMHPRITLHSSWDIMHAFSFDLRSSRRQSSLTAGELKENLIEEIKAIYQEVKNWEGGHTTTAWILQWSRTRALQKSMWEV